MFARTSLALGGVIVALVAGCGDDASSSATSSGTGGASSAAAGGGDDTTATSPASSPSSAASGGEGGDGTASSSGVGGDPGTGGQGGGGTGGAQTFSMTDALRGVTTGNQQGGQLGPDGWTVTGNADRIIYELPRLVRGSFQFTISNVTMEQLPLADHEVFAMYEGGWGMEEPIGYDPEFRNNHYKAMIRVYGQPEGDRAGQQKLMWGMCPSGDPGHGKCGCGSFFEEPFGGDPTWDGSPQVMRVEWGDGVTRYFKNEVEVLVIDWSASGLSFGPQELHASLGTSRPLAVDTAAMPIGAVFSDVIVEGTLGEQAVCP